MILNWLKPVEFVADGKSQTGRVVWDDGEIVTVQTDEVVEMEDDGVDEDGNPVCRPIYRRYYLSRDAITNRKEN